MHRLDLPEDQEAIHAVLIDRVNQHTSLLEKHEKILNSVVEVNKKQTAQLNKIQEDTAKIVEIFKTSEGAITMLKWGMKLIVQIAAVFAAIAGMGYFNWFQGDK